MEMKLRDALLGVEVAEPRMAGPLQVFGLRWELPGDLSYLTLDEALEGKTLEVTELDEGGSVPELRVTNKGDMLVFLMAGEQLVGAKQNRVFNASMMVPAKSETVVPVSCVERGRWGYRSRKFGSGGSSSHPKLRREMNRQAYDTYRKRGYPGSDQGRVWSEVDRKLRAMGSKSPSDALQQTYDDRRAKLDDAVAELRLPEDCCGAAFVFGGRVAGVELFDKPATLAKVLPKLVSAYALDAEEESELSGGEPAELKPATWTARLGRLFSKPGAADAASAETDAELSSQLDSAAVASWLRVAAEADSESFDSPGLGEDLRFESEGLVGASLLVEELPVHTELFSEEK